MSQYTDVINKRSRTWPYGTQANRWRKPADRIGLFSGLLSDSEQAKPDRGR